MATCNLTTLQSEACANGFQALANTDQVLTRAVILQLLCNLSAGISGSSNLSGSGSPVGVVTPDAVNQFYRDTSGNALWQSTGLTSADWIQWI